MQIETYINREGKKTNHVIDVRVGGEYTLCGLAFDSTFPEDEEIFISSHKGKMKDITCKRCKSIIIYCVKLHKEK